MVSRTSVGAFIAGTAAVTAVFGAGAAAGVLGLLLEETANEVAVAPAGWSNPGWSPIGSAGVAGGTRFTPFYEPAITSAEITSGIAVGDSGDHQIAALLTYSGVDPNNPVITSGATNSPTATTAVSLGPWLSPGARAGDILLACIATDRDSATLSTNAAASWSGATGTNNGFILNGSTASGAGGGVIVHELALTADIIAGGFVSFSCTITSSIWAGLILQINAPRGAPFPFPNPMLPLLCR